MPHDKLKHFLARVKGDPFAHLNMNRGKVNVQELFFQHEVVLEPDSFFSYRAFLTKYDIVRMDVEVLAGSEIDLLVMNDYNFGKYTKIEDFIYIVGGSVLKMIRISNVFLAQDVGIYHIILDNTYYPENGARPNRDINGGTVCARFSARTHVPLQMDFQSPVKLRSTFTDVR
jgi:hypothetical protein